MVIALYLVLAFLIVFLSIKLSKYVDMLDKTTKLSGALIGGVFLAAVTSLPELFTSISAVLFLGQSELVLGNVMGSDIFNMAVLGVLLIIFIKSFSKKNLNKSLIWTSIFLVLLYGFASYAALCKYQLLMWGINVISIVIITIYAVSVKFISEETEKEEDVTVPLSKKQIITRFILCSVLLVATSIGITYLSDSLAETLHLGKTLAGAILLGVATSLPEVVSTISLMKMGNFDAGVSNILGSNTFNFLILSLADFMNYKAPIYINNSQSKYLLLGGLVSAVSVAILLLIKSQVKNQKLWTKIASVILCVVPVTMYLLFLIMPNI